MKKITIKDIAKEAGVSATTISRYLNGRYDYMSADTKAKIEEIIEKTGYRPNNLARSLRSNESKVIGVIISDIKNQFFASLLDAINREAVKTNYALSIMISDNSSEIEALLIKRLLDNGVDGLLINTVGDNDAFINEVAEKNPVVLLDRAVEHSDIPVVTSNNEELMREILMHLKSQGYRNISLITEPYSTSTIRKIRIDSFNESTERFGLNKRVFVVDSLDVSASHTIDTMYDYINSQPHSAVITINSKMLNLVLSAHNMYELHSKRQFGLVSFDDYLLNSLLGITTAAQNTDQLGFMAFQTLQKQIKSGNKEKSETSGKIIIPGNLIIRSSTYKSN